MLFKIDILLCFYISGIGNWIEINNLSISYETNFDLIETKFLQHSSHNRIDYDCNRSHGSFTLADYANTQTER